jgi:hypothetical protein
VRILVRASDEATRLDFDQAPGRFAHQARGEDPSEVACIIAILEQHDILRGLAKDG